MLILGRNVNESITLVTSDGVITIKLVELGHDERGRFKIRLGIEAPPAVEVVRSELLEQFCKRCGNPMRDHRSALIDGRIRRVCLPERKNAGIVCAE